MEYAEATQIITEIREDSGLCAQLTDDEVASLRSCSAQEIIAALQRLEVQHRYSGRPKHYVAKIRPLIEGLEKFGPALDVFANADPHGILSLVWGSIRLVIAVSGTA